MTNRCEENQSQSIYRYEKNNNDDKTNNNYNNKVKIVILIIAVVMIKTPLSFRSSLLKC